jgi:hypothetical protein
MIKNIKPLKEIINVGDIHFGIHSNSYEWLNIAKDFFYKLLIPFVKYLKEKKGYTDIQIIFDGDINDNKQLINNLIQNEQIRIFQILAEICDVHIYIGNHDTPFKDKIDVGEEGSDKQYVNSCRSIGLIDGVQVYEDPIELDIANGEKALLMPYNHNPKDELDIINASNAQYLFAHTEIAGFHYDGAPVNESKHNKISDFSKFKKVYSGHIHKNQEKENILFVGTPYQTKRSESGNACGFYFIDFMNGKESFIENKISPRYLKIPLFNLMDMKLSEVNKMVENNFVDIIAPSSLMYKINFANVTDVIDKKYRNFEYRPLTTHENIDVLSLIGESGLIDDGSKVDVGSKLPEYLDQLEMVKIGKENIILQDSVRKKLKDFIMDLYKKAESNQELEELEETI